jgi:predicted porin
MKKTLVALAALASVSAFAQVTITGTMDAGAQQYNIRGNSVQDVGANGSSTTALIFSGTEDLGGGLKAVFQYEIDPNITQTSSKTAGTAATGTTSNITTSAGNGQSFVGLNGGFGAIRFGTPNSSTLAANGDGNLGFGTAIGSGYRVSTFDAVRFQSSLKYDTPTMSGLSASYLYVPKNGLQANTANASATGNLQNQVQGRDQIAEIAFAYINGPLTARLATLQTQQWADTAATTDVTGTAATWTAATGAKSTLNTLSAKYKATNELDLAVFYQTVRSDTLNKAAAGVSSATAASTMKFDRKTTGLAATYQLSPATKLMFNYQTAKNGSEASGTGTASKSVKVTGLGADYALSKRTAAYFRYEKNDDQADIRSTTGYTDVAGSTTKYTATAIGIRHTY